LKGIAEGTYKTKHAEAARLCYTTTHRNTQNTGTTDTRQSLSADTLMHVIALPVVKSNA